MSDRTANASPALPRALVRWADADWPALAQARQAAPDGIDARLAMVTAAAAIQAGDRHGGAEKARRALADGCDPGFAASVLLASAHHALGMAAVAAAREDRAIRHFEQVLFERRPAAEVARVAARRMASAREELELHRKAAAARRSAGLAADAASFPGWLDDLAATSLLSPDLHEAVDAALWQTLSTADERVRFLIALARRLQARQDPVMPVHYLNGAKEMAADASPAVKLVLARELVAVNQPSLALDLVLGQTLSALDAGPPERAFVNSLRRAYRSARDAESAHRQHGHELLLAYLRTFVPDLRRADPGRALTFVEIGTTREDVPSQGSTRKIAEFCRSQGIDFVTVDMDPQNARMAQRLFDAMGVGFRAVSMKGEDYLRERRTPVDFVFLDAYDFDHGQHSELRQSRYRKFLGSPIEERACHQMHLECAQALDGLLSDDGLVCVDDTWLEGDSWTAKGTLAVPYLLNHGFELVMAKHRAVLLRRAWPLATEKAGRE
ncbi:MAG: hypothetical protein U1F53_04650 [Burkholderiaceae bacterium]